MSATRAQKRLVLSWGVWTGEDVYVDHLAPSLKESGLVASKVAGMCLLLALVFMFRMIRRGMPEKMMPLTARVASLSIPVLMGGVMLLQTNARQLVDVGNNACSTDCVYDVKFEMSWSKANHPVDYPNDAHWSPFWGVVHNDQYSMWREGELASDAMKQLSELGEGGLLADEVMSCGANCGELLKYDCDAMAGTCTASGTFTAYPDRTFWSAAGMLVPSPDWLTGADAWQLCGEDGWMGEMSLDVNAYDAGTDLGATFLSPDQGTDDREPIFSFGAVEPPTSSIFFNPDMNVINPVGTITVKGCTNEATGSAAASGEATPTGTAAMGQAFGTMMSTFMIGD